MGQENSRPCLICWKDDHKTDECPCLTAAAQKLADAIDNDIMERLKDDQRKLNPAKEKDISIVYFCPETRQIIAIDPTWNCRVNIGND